MSDSRTKVWFALFVLAVFGVGAAAGVFVGKNVDDAEGSGRSGVPRGSFAPTEGQRRPDGGPPPEVLLQRLSRDLELTPEQRTQLQTVLRAGHDRVEQLQRDVRGRFDEEQRHLRTEIRKRLTSEQQERFDRIVEQGRRGRGRGRDGGRPGALGPGPGPQN